MAHGTDIGPPQIQRGKFVMCDLAIAPSAYLEALNDHAILGKMITMRGMEPEGRLQTQSESHSSHQTH